MSKLFCLALSSLVLAGTARAQDAADQPETVVSANRYAQTVDAALADVSVIDHAEIETSGATDLYQLLRLQAGVDIVRSGGPGTQTALFLRGSNSNHVLVLIDGVRVSSLNTGAFAWEQLPLETVERVEIVRGPRAAVWGSDAIGGVIQIFTRTIDGAALALQYGSHADAAGSAGIGHWNERGEGYSIGVGLRHVRGFSAQNPEGYSYDPDDDGLRSRSLVARGALDAGSQRLSAHGYFDDAHVEFDQGESHVTEQAVGGEMTGALAPRWSHRLAVGAARETLSTPVYGSRFRSHREELDWRHRFDIGRGQQVAAGVSLLHERGSSIDDFSGSTVFSGSRSNRALYAGWYGQHGRLDWELSGRHDDNSRFGTADTGSAALGLRFSDAARLIASWGQGFRAPSLNEQLSPGYGGYYAGDPDLRPERSHSSEIALELTPTEALRLRIGHYRTEIGNLISFTGGDTFRAENIARARVDGSEARLDFHAYGWTLAANATWQDARDLDTGERLLRRPPRKAGASVARRFGDHAEAGLEWLAADRRPEIGGDLPGYAIANARFAWHFGPRAVLRLRGDNLFDRDYSELRGFNTAGRSFWLELALRSR